MSSSWMLARARGKNVQVWASCSSAQSAHSTSWRMPSGPPSNRLNEKPNDRSRPEQQPDSRVVETSPLYLRLLPAQTKPTKDGARKMIVLREGVTENAVTVLCVQ